MMHITISVYPTEKNNVVEHYESLGMRLEKTIKVSRDHLDLVFSCDKNLGSQILVHDTSARGSIEFEDGTSSPLYVRRGPSLD